MVETAHIFVGREQEIGALCAALDAACAGQGRLALLAGEPGIGKTRTALELTQRAAKQNARFLWGRCHEEAGAPPYWPWVQILQALVSTPNDGMLRADLDAGASDIAEIVPEVRHILPGIEPPAPLHDQSETRFRLFGSIVRFLVNVSRRQPLVIILDDLHWADVPSLRLLEFLAPELADSGLLVVGTYRETDLSRRHRLSDTLGALARVPRCVRLHMLGLNAEEVRHFISTAAGVVPPGWLARAIHDQTEGNPLFMREVVRFLTQDGRFAGSAPGSAIPTTIRLPEGIREVIGRRLNLLSPLCNTILALAAVIGRQFTLDLLLRASSEQGEDAVLEALDEALGAHIVEETAPRVYQFTHTLVRITLYDELRTGQRRRLHHVVGEAIETAYRRDPEPVLAELARHFHAAGLTEDAGRAIDYATRAGNNAVAALAFEDAIGFFQTALDTLDTLSVDDPTRRCALLLQLGDAQRKANDFPEALQTLHTASVIARTQQMPLALAEVAFAYADVAWRHDMQPAAQSGQLLQEAIAGLAATDVGLRIKLMGSLARDRLHVGGVDAAKAIALQAIMMARDLGDPAVLASSLAGLLDIPWQPHETEQMLTDATEVAALAERANDLEHASRGHFRRVSLLLELGDIDAAIAAIGQMGRLNARIRQPIFALFELGLRATIALLRGDLAEAERLIIRTTKTQPPNRVHVTDPVSMLIFTLRREQGRLGELGPLVAMFVSHNTGVATWRPGLALLYVELNDLPAARAVFDELAAGEFGSVPRDGRWATCLIYLTEVCVALGDLTRAAVLYQLLLPWAGRNIVMGGGTGCWGSSGRFLGMLATVMGHWVDAERHFTEALAMNARLGALAPLAHTHCDLAGMLLARGYPGDFEKASHHLGEANARAAALGLAALEGKVAARRQGLAEASLKPAPPDNLTIRELEVLRLLAIGRGNADIALVLAIGQSTVATHVHNILTKTGCANRTEAAAYAVRHNLQAR